MNDQYMLTLKRPSKCRPDGQWSGDDYDVFDGERNITCSCIQLAPRGVRKRMAGLRCGDGTEGEGTIR